MPTAFSAAPAKKPESRLDDGVLRALAYGAATLLLFHELVCRCRPCRRARGCLMRSRDGRPDCLGAAPPDALALHAALLAETARLLETLAFAPSTPVAPLSRDPDERELQEAAFDILHALLPRQGALRERLSARRHAQNTLSRPPFTGADLAEVRDFLRFVGVKRIAPELTGGVPATLPRPPARTAAVARSPHLSGAGGSSARPPGSSGKAGGPASHPPGNGGGTADLLHPFGKDGGTADLPRPFGKGGGCACLQHWYGKGDGTACLSTPAALRARRRAGCLADPAVGYSAAALAADASSTAAKAASITSGPAPGFVASADRIWR
ncbi:hypothetical protein [Mycoplana ramosa]|uniref:Uncharacterized protein n=1 Tax=Mycoplana ramosa TaxID=40837 RepID=A0ABW3YQQ9_MYCRA